MRTRKILSNMFLIALLAFTASGVVNANLAPGLQNFGLESHQGQSLFDFLLRLEKSEYSTTNVPGCSIVGKGYKIASDGKTFVSSNGLKTFRWRLSNEG